MTHTNTPQLADGHLWLHFSKTGDWLSSDSKVPVFERADGCHVWDREGTRYVDGLSALFCAQVGYGRDDIVDAMAQQLRTLPFATNWGVAHDPALQLASELAVRFPGDVDHFFFVNSGSEAVETAIKLAQQYHALNGEPERTKIISRRFAYHGTTLGALGVTGLPKLSDVFQPLRPVHLHAPNTNPYRPQVDDPAAAIEDLVLAAGPSTVSAVVVEPVQNAGGCLVPPDDYFPRLREICDRHGILLITDEVITGFGRLGYWTGAEKYGVVPDIVTFAKGVTGAYAPMGGVGFRTHLGERFVQHPDQMFKHGATWGGHPAAAAAALANIRVFDDEDLLVNVRNTEGWFEGELRRLMDAHELIGDVRGAGYFWALEFVADRDTKDPLTTEAAQELLKAVLGPRTRELGLICRPDDRDQPVLQLAPPLTAGQEVLGEIVGIVDQVMAEATKRMRA